jgi:DNA-binding response OmpR family regulator
MKDKTLLRDYQSLYRLTGGIYPILKIAIMQFSDKYKDCEKLYSNNQVQSCLESIIDIVSEDSTNMIQDDFVNLGLLREDGKFKSEWLTRALNERAPSDLTRHEKKVLQLLKDFREDIVSREDIAKCMWGPNYLDRYSEWAIDKIISRIRKKLEAGDSELSIITYKGEGYGIR